MLKNIFHFSSGSQIAIEFDANRENQLQPLNPIINRYNHIIGAEVNTPQTIRI